VVLIIKVRILCLQVAHTIVLTILLKLHKLLVLDIDRKGN